MRAIAILKKPKKQPEHTKFEKHMSLEKLFSTVTSITIVKEIFDINEEKKNIDEDSQAD